MKYSFSKRPGAWERQLIRRCEHSQYFAPLPPPSPLEVAEAQNRDQQELARFQLGLESLIVRCTELTEESSAATITAIKKDLDACHDTAFGLGADLTEQTEAIAMLNEVITTAMRRALQDDENLRLRLIQNEARRLEKLSLLERPIVCDLLRAVSPIPQGQLTAALLSESDDAFKSALKILTTDRKKYLAKRLDIIIESMDSEDHKSQATRKLELLTRNLPDTPVTNEELLPG